MASGGPQLVGAWGIPLRQSGVASGQWGPTPTLANPASFLGVSAESHERTPVVAGDDSSDDVSYEGDAQGADVDALHAAMFCDYGEDDEDETDVAKIRALLVAGGSGGAACLICLERVRATDFVWDCKSGCYAIFHLTCVQSWARQSLDAAEQRAQSRLSEANFPGAAAAAASHWYCPKCRAAYSRSEIPRQYACFCGKQANPAADPWLAPHTCGEKCGRTLAGNCEHQCMLLCHPGPCPSCPQLRRVRCFCEERSEVRRCGRGNFSCGSECGKRLPCENHACESVCHVGDCPPCTKLNEYACQCKREKALRMCTERDFQCERPCGRQLNCGKHSCQEGCHSGSCGDCKLAGRRSCPCGKTDYKDLACDQTVPTCGSTCEKVLACSIHRCQERCHFGPCNSTCRVMTSKACHCGSLKKLIPCYQDLQCERKCQRVRDCTRHNCRKRCCNGECPPCSEICGRKLRCGNHKCPAPCHRGVCAPCPVSVRISCACGKTSFEVPCGMERDQKPPRCSKPCRIPPGCSHGAKCKPHACHYGDCPPCQLVCNSEMPCSHKCPRRCHGPRPESNPEYSLKPSKRKKTKLANGYDLRKGSPCPPCLEPVVKQCLGQHYGIEKTMVCSAVKEFQCDNLCGNLLVCGNHSCTLPCHSVKMISMKGTSKSDLREQRPKVSYEEYSITCDQCLLHCEKDRALCPHPCPLPCHPGGCPPCKALVKRSCHCKTLVHAFDCDVFTSASESERENMLSCGGPCHRKLPNCSHMCSDICHPGPCQSAGNCRKKVAVRCACQRLKKEWLCLDTQAALSSGRHAQKEVSRGGLFIGLIPCDKECQRLAAIKLTEDEAQQLRRIKWKASEVAVTPRSTVRRRKMRHQTDHQNENTFPQDIRAALLRWSMILCVIALVALVIYFVVVGLVALNAWMNERDAARIRRRRLQYNL